MNNGHDAYLRLLASMPSPAHLAAALTEPAGAFPDRFEEWSVVSTARSPAHALVVLDRRIDDRDHYCFVLVFDRVDGRWHARGGGGGSRSASFGSRPIAGGKPVDWLGRSTLEATQWHPRLRVTGGRARSDVATVVVQTHTFTFDVAVDENGWFHVFIDGDEPATITARDHSGTPVLDVDGLPVTLRFE